MALRAPPLPGVTPTGLSTDVARMAGIPPKAPPPQGRPVPLLQNNGMAHVNSVQDLNSRVQTIVDAHTQAKGYTPSKGLVYDILRSPLDPQHYPGLFQVTSQSHAQAVKALGNFTPVDHPDLMVSLKQAVSKGGIGYPQWIQQNQEQIHSALDDPMQRQKLISAVTKMQLTGVTWGSSQQLQKASVTYTAKQKQANLAQAKENVLTAGIEGSGILDTAASGAMMLGGAAGKAFGQVAQSLGYSPFGMYILGKALLIDEGRMLTGQSPTQTQKIAKATFQGYKQDVLHPKENAGYLFLDILGFASAGAGAASRIASAGRALSAGEGAAAAAKGLLTRPRGGTIPIRKGELVEHQLVSDNPVVGAAQKLVAKARQRGIDIRHEGNQTVPGSILAHVLPEKARKLIEANFSPERKLGREIAARKRVEIAVNTALQKDLETVTGWSVAQNTMLSRLPNVARKGLTRGEQKAIFSLGVDDPTPIATQITFHQRMIDSGIGIEDAHLRHIADLKLAQKALDNPRPRFREAYALAQEAVQEMERMKIQDLGLSPVTAEGRVAKLGQVLRGETVGGTAPPEAYVSTSHEFVGSVPDVASAGQKGYVYHRTNTENIAEIKRTGLQPGETSGDIKGVYFTNNPLTASRLSGKGKNSAYLRVRENAVPDLQLHPNKAYGEMVTPHAVPKEAIEYLGKDGKWHPLNATEVPPSRITESSFYVPTVRLEKSKRAPKTPAMGVRAGPYGISLPQPLPELTHEFTGDAIRTGDIRIDATNLIGEAYGRTVRAVQIKHDHANLWKAATATRRSEFDRPIRDIREVPGRLRELMAKIDEGQFTAAEASVLDPAEVKNLLDYLYPGRLNKRTGRYESVDLEGNAIPNVRWVDERLLGPEATRMPQVVGTGTKIMEAVNEPIRDATLYVRPGYILNAVGNTGMLLMQQGGFAVPNVMRALAADHLYGERVVAALDNLVGNSRTMSFTSEAGGITKVSQSLAHMWNRVADNYFRRAAVIYELRRKGYKTRADFERAIFGPDKTDVMEASRRGNKAMVEFDNLTWFEKQYLRHMIFVYPWVSRSLVWSIRTVFEHPVQTDLLSHLGRVSEDEDPILKQAPEWFARTGYIPIGWDSKGNPKVVNPTSINTFATLEQLGSAFSAGVTNTRYASAGDLLGPAATFGIHGLTGKDQYGNDYPNGDWVGAAKEVLGGIPQATAIAKSEKKPQNVVAPLTITDRNTLNNREHAALKRIVFSPGWLNGLGTLIGGGLINRTVDTSALAARYWRDQPPLDRQKHEQQLVSKALSLQGEFLKKPVPATVKAAVALGGEITRRDLQFKIANGRDPTQAEQAQADLKTYQEKGLLKPEDATKLGKQLGSAVTAQDFQNFRSQLFAKYGGGKELSDWDSSVRLVASFKKPVLAQKALFLHQQGLIPDPGLGNQATLDKAGRQYLAFVNEAKARQKAITDAPSDEHALLQAEFRSWIASHDQPLPGTKATPVQLGWAYLTDQQRQDAMDSHTNASWPQLSAFDKQLLTGKPVPKTVEDGWAAYQRTVYSFRQDNPGKTIQRVQMNGLAKQIDAVYPGFLNDYTFSLQPKVERFQQLRTYKSLPDKALFDRNVAQPAKLIAQAIKQNGASGYYMRAWRVYVSEQVKPWLETHPQLKAALDGFGTGFLDSLPG